MGEPVGVRARAVIGADGANSAVAKQRVPFAEEGVFVAAYHEIVKAPKDDPSYDGSRCDIYYRGDLSPDFYSWIFPHGDVLSVGTGTAHKGFSIRRSVTRLRELTGLTGETVRREGAPIPLKPLPRWDDGQNVVLAGDASGVVAPASGEGIYYAMVGGQLAAQAASEFLTTGDPKALRLARKRFLRLHGRVFWVLGIMQRFWYTTDKRRERFVTMCADPDVQYLTWQAYMNKELVKARPSAHVRIFFRDLGHLFGIGRTAGDGERAEERTPAGTAAA
jgi:geranylgeranyl reductase